MATVEAIHGEPTYNITGLTTKQAAVIHALLGNGSTGRRDGVSMEDVYVHLDSALRTDKTFRQRKTVKKESVDFYAPENPIYGFYTVEV